ncbi:MAG: hypothetical protein IKE61_03170 [Coriobacteriales bacterium]|nr:hypothetical protein [Coriobacteriales bacterium]
MAKDDYRLAKSIALILVGAGIAAAIVMNKDLRREIQSQTADVLKITGSLIGYGKKLVKRIGADESARRDAYDESWEEALSAVERHV